MSMATLSELINRRDELDEQIRKAQEILRAREKETKLKEDYVKVVCPSCIGGADIISDPPYEDVCEGCSIRGFLYARRFDSGKHEYDMEYSGISVF